MAHLELTEDDNAGFGVFPLDDSLESRQDVLREALANLRRRYARGNMSLDSYKMRRDSFLNYLSYNRVREERKSVDAGASRKVAAEQEASCPRKRARRRV